MELPIIIPKIIAIETEPIGIYFEKNNANIPTKTQNKIPLNLIILNSYKFNMLNLFFKNKKSNILCYN
jgi:intein-encoded DNA endonuclease-like protein